MQTEKRGPSEDKGAAAKFAPQQRKTINESIKSLSALQMSSKQAGKPQKTNDIHSLQAEIEKSFAPLRHLPNQKLHPFDLKPQELLEIKQFFPEFKKKTSQNRESTKIKGLEIEILKEKLKGRIQVNDQQMDAIIAKLDHKNEKKINWTEFLNFLSNEGIRREVVNDAQLYGFGVKRLQEKDRINLKQSEEQVVEYYIDNMIMLRSQKKNFRLLLCLFENHEAKVYDAKNFKLVQELTFPSDYAVPKECGFCKKEQLQKHVQTDLTETIKTGTATKLKTGVQDKKKFMQKRLGSPGRNPGQIGNDGNPNVALDEYMSAPLASIQEQPNRKPRRTQSIDNKQPSSQINITSKLSKITDMKKVTESSDYGTNSFQRLKSNQQNYRSTRANSALIGSYKTEPGKNVSVDATGTYFNGVRPKSKLEMKNAKLQSEISKTVYDSKRWLGGRQKMLSQFTVIPEQHRNSDIKTKDWRAFDYHMSKIDGEKLDKQEKELRMNDQMRIYGFKVLGIEAIADDDEQAAFKRKSGLASNIRTDDDTSKKYKENNTNMKREKQSFDAYFKERDKELKDVENGLEQKFIALYRFECDNILEKGVELNQQKKVEIFRSCAEKVGYRLMPECIQKELAIDPKKEYEILQQKKNYINFKLDIVQTAFKKKAKQIDRLKEINKYFYRPNSPSPYQYALEFNKKQREGKGDEEVPISDDPNYCTPEMIQGFCDRLKQDEAKKALQDQQNNMTKDKGKDKKHKKVEKDEQGSEEDVEETTCGERKKIRELAALKETDDDKRRIKKLDQKAVYCVAANYNEQLGLLALALIDREIKIYKVKQNGTKISIVEYYSFKIMFGNKPLCPVSSVHIENYVTNNKTILVFSSQQGDIAIYLLEEGEGDDKDKKPKIKLDKSFNFFDRGPNKAKVENDEDELEGDFERSQSERNDSFNPGQFHSEQEDRSGYVDSTKQIQDDYWDILMNTRKKTEGPDGVKIWNAVYSMIKDQEIAMHLTKELIDIKLVDTQNEAVVKPIDKRVKQVDRKMDEFTDEDFVRRISGYIAMWNMAMQSCGNQIKEATKRFRADVSRQLKVEQEKKDTKKRAKTADPYEEDKNVRRKSSASRTSSVARASLNNRLSKNDAEAQSVTTKLSKDKEKESNKNPHGKRRNENEITGVRYIKDIGLIATAFNGTVKIFDAFNFHQLWKDSNKSRDAKQHTNIACFDVSTGLGLMATGGAEGKLMLLDPFAFGIINAVEAHKNSEILSVFFYEQQQQIITTAIDRTICLWDAFRLDRIQIIKDTANTHIPKFTSTVFDEEQGMLYTGCQQVQVWKAAVDSKVEINALQVQTLSKTILQERNMTQLLKLGGTRSFVGQNGADSKTGKVLISNKSSLVEIIVNENDPSEANFIITVDSENLLRGWSIKQEVTNFSYKIPMKKRVTAAAVDSLCQYIAVGNTIGECKVLNFQSGGVLYNLPHSDKEITCLKFLSGMSEFWLVAGCWSGKLVLWTEPNEDNNFQVLAKGRIGHRGDVLALDCSDTYIVSGGVDGLLSVWNQFSGVLKFAVRLPDPESEVFFLARADGSEVKDVEEETRGKRPGNQIRKTIVGLMFHPGFAQIVCVLQEGGNIHMVDISNGMVVNEFVAHVKVNSSWACDALNNKVLVVGDLGKAALFDISMGQVYEEPTSEVVAINSKSSEKKPKVRQAVYVRKPNERWKVYKQWFIAHRMTKNDSAYVNSVKFSKSIRLFVTGTNSGEVKLWSPTDCICMGTINSSDWNEKQILNYALSVQRKLKTKSYKELISDEVSSKAMKIESEESLSDN